MQFLAGGHALIAPTLVVAFDVVQHSCVTEQHVHPPLHLDQFSYSVIEIPYYIFYGHFTATLPLLTG